MAKAQGVYPCFVALPDRLGPEPKASLDRLREVTQPVIEQFGLATQFPVWVEN